MQRAPSNIYDLAGLTILIDIQEADTRHQICKDSNSDRQLGGIKSRRASPLCSDVTQQRLVQ